MTHPIDCCPTAQVKEFHDAFLNNLFGLAKSVPAQINVDEQTRKEIESAIMHGIAKAAREAQVHWNELYKFQVLQTVN